VRERGRARRADVGEAPRPGQGPLPPGPVVRGDQAPGAVRRAGGAEVDRDARPARVVDAGGEGDLPGGDDVVLRRRLAPGPEGRAEAPDGAVVRPVRSSTAQRDLAAVGGCAGPSVELLRRDPELARRAAENGHETYCWTVDEPADVRLCERAGVRYVATNKPAATRSHLIGSSGSGSDSVTA